MTMVRPTTPCYVIDVDALRRNLSVLRGVMDRTGAHILLAQKAFSCYGVYPLVAEYLSGATASGLYEAKLWHEEISSKPEWQARGIENHVYNPAFQEKDIEEIFSICDHIVFNSPAQLLKYGARAKAAGLAVGLRINPEFSTQTDHAIYDPCSPGSRLGTTLAEFEAMIASHPDLLPSLIQSNPSSPKHAQANTSSLPGAQANTSSPQGGTEGGFHYRLGGPTCLAGDIIGDYGFDHPLREGEVLQFNDMAIYSMVKNNTFNGMPLPTIYLKNGEHYQLWKQFGYEDFKCRL